MRALPLVPDGCALSAEGLAGQLGRAERLAPAVAGTDVAADELRVSFAPGVDRVLLGELVETERDCCSFLAIDYDDRARVLHVRSSDAQGREVVQRLGAVFAGEAA